jgi:hypothetical protein
VELDEIDEGEQVLAKRCYLDDWLETSFTGRREVRTPRTQDLTVLVGSPTCQAASGTV